MEAAKSAANEEMQENKHTDYIYMVTGDRLVISMNAELDHHLADEMRDVIDTIIEERGVRHLIFDFSKIPSNCNPCNQVLSVLIPKSYETKIPTNQCRHFMFIIVYLQKGYPLPSESSFQFPDR